MSNDIVIRVKDLGKSYLIHHQGDQNQSRLRYHRFSEELITWATGPWRWLDSRLHRQKILPKRTKEDFWALKDVSFDVRRGEVIGIIGRNGAGKTTLLKVLSRITEPTTGRVEIDGRVASLLEVGTGFHPELTGRENIFLNGAILGMNRAEVRKKFDEIVAFAEVEKFLDTPVKRYSSGMYVRLAFAVAAHLEPEILLIDEVLAVGDAAFQKKCVGKVSDVTKEGRTVLFVSHNMAHIQNLTRNTIVLKNGKISFIGETNTAIQNYVMSSQESYSVSLADRKERTGISPGTLRGIRMSMNSKPIDGVALAGMPLEIEIDYTTKYIGKLDFFLAFYDSFERRILHVNSIQSGFVGIPKMGKGKVICKIPKFPLTPGEYSLAVAVDQNGETLDRIEHAACLTVNMGDFFGTGQTVGYNWGICLVENEWEAL